MNTLIPSANALIRSEYYGLSSASARVVASCFRSSSYQTLTAFPPFETVEKLILHEKKGNCVPVYVQLPADLITPVMAFLRISKDSKYSFLLESVLAGENIARYSFIGAGTSFYRAHGPKRV